RELKRSVGGSTLHIQVADPDRHAEALRVLTGVFGNDVQQDAAAQRLSVRVAREELAPQALAALAASNIAVHEFSLAQPTLDDVFFALTGRVTEEVQKEHAA